MRVTGHVIAAAILLAGASQVVEAKKGAELVSLADVEAATARLPGPPAKGSDAEKADLAKLKAIQADRASRQQIDAAYDDRKETMARFLAGMGIEFTKKAEPRTAKLIKTVAVEVESALEGVKQRWVRARPFTAEANILRCPGKPASNSYPSSHAAFGVAAGRVLAELMPQNAERLKARGIAFGESRLVCGFHYPTDVEGGRIAGAAVADALLKSPPFKKELEKAKAEIAESEQ
jgi:acid phosphatase (class A)